MATGNAELDAALEEVDKQGVDELEAVIGEARTRPEPEKKTEKKKSSTAPRRGSLERRVQEPLEFFGAFIDKIDPDDICGNAIIDGAPEVAQAIDQLARENAKFKAWIESGLTGSATVNLVLALGGMVVPIVAAHRPQRRLPRAERERRLQERQVAAEEDILAEEMAGRQMQAEYDAIEAGAEFEQITASPITPSQAPNFGDGHAASTLD